MSRRAKSPQLLVLFLIAACLVLAVVCACLSAALALLRAHFHQGLCSDYNNTTSEIPLQDTGIMLADGSAVRTVSEDLPYWETHFRLPSDTLPLHYDLLLHPDLENGTFSGEVTIRIRSVNVRSFFAVNTKRLDIYETSLRRADGGDVEVKRAFEYERNEFWIVEVVEEVAAGEYDLRLKFRGSLTGRIVGFYRSVYTDRATNRKRTIATSKFQPTYARQAFPCFDEPSYKSKFSIKLVRPTLEYNALSNTDITSELPDTPSVGLTTVTFNTSVDMVTYLACFIVSDFTSLPSVDVINPYNTFPFSVYATPAQTKSLKTQFASDTGVTVVKHYIDYFDIAYPLPKLDMIAIPDFVSGAMEHWGLITFREANLLYSKDVSSVTNQQRVATVIAHELAHMWFGNLVTLKWWDDLWLNEGFASYMEYKGTDAAYGAWNMMDQFLVDDLHPVLKLDAVLSSHPIVQTVSHPDQITELFDTISYNKGAAVIRMLEDFLGAVNFQTGIHAFLTKFALGNAVTQDLWDAMQVVADPSVNVTTVMDLWTRQMGFPVVSVKKLSDTSYELKQQRFLSDPDADTSGDVSPYGYKWEIPLTYITNSQPIPQRDWLPMSGAAKTITIPAGTSWFKFNYHQTGYYRVNYEVDHWKVLGNVLKADPKVMPTADRAHLVDDVFSLADANHIPYDIALDMSKYLELETEYVPWSVASSKLSALNSILADSLAFPKLRTYVQRLVSKMYDQVTWDVPASDDPTLHLSRRLRVTVLDLACSLGYEKCLTDVGAKFTAWINNPTVRPSPDVRTLIYYHGLASAGSEANWDKVWQLYLDEEDAQEKIKLMNALAAVKEPWLLRRYIQFAKNDALIRSQDYFSVLTYISNNPVGTPIVWDFVRAEWQYLVDTFTLNDRYLGRLIPSITASFTTQFKLDEMKAFFAQYPDAGAGAVAREQALEAVDNRIQWLKRNEANVLAWLNTEVPTP